MTRARDLADSASVVDPLDGLYGSSSSPIVITVKVVTKTASHPYYGDGSSLGYTLNTVESPAIKFGGTDAATSNTEYVYRFDQSDSSNSGHPLRFYLDAAKATAFTSGVTTNGTAGSSGAYTQIAVDSETPKILYYQCSSHAYMGNYATVSGSLSFSAGSLRIADTAVTSTGAEINKLDALSRGSLIYGNASAATAILTKGSANQVLTSDGTDIAWANAAAGGTDGWELITTITPTAATTITGANIISSSYEAVRIILSNIVTSGTYQDNSASGAGNGLDMRLATGGSVDSGNNYGAPSNNTKDQIDGDADFQISANHHTINGQWIYPNGDGFNGEILITGLQRGSGINKNIYARTTIEANNTWYKSTYSVGIYNGGTVTGIQFFTEGATATYVATGQVKVYGLKVS